MNRQDGEVDRQDGDVNRQDGNMNRQDGDVDRQYGDVNRQDGDVNRQDGDVNRQDGDVNSLLVSCHIFTKSLVRSEVSKNEARQKARNVTKQNYIHQLIGPCSNN